MTSPAQVAVSIPSTQDEVETSLSKSRWFWIIFSYVLTFYIPDCCLVCCYRTEAQRQAFREKLAVVLILLIVSCVFIGIYVVVPVLVCHNPPIPAFEHVVPTPKAGVCHWYRVGLEIFFAVIAGVIAIKVLAALWLMIPWKTHDRRNRSIIINIPAYTEDQSALEKTLRSAAALNYPHSQKLLMIVCDGLVTGKGNPKTTPEIVLDILGRHLEDCPETYTYDSLNGLNRAKVYTGFYYPYANVGAMSQTHDGVPYVVIVKVGREHEQRKPGNRGKRDSQLIVMSFLHKLFYHEPLSHLETKLAADIEMVLQRNPHDYELIMTIDSDTWVHPNALEAMVTHFNNPKVIAVCGETRVGNPDSLIGAAQVYEYYINHHLNKAFESVLGKVTCLPGCFSVIRIKTLPTPAAAPYSTVLPASGFVDVPLDPGAPYLIHESIVKTYSNRNLDSLHVKNLLSLGEDRFLTSLLIRTFPDHQTKFVPKATCYTTVPDEFCVLLSQRRRWINSTIHNMIELLKIPMGSASFLLKLNIILDLASTFVLPIGLIYIAYLIFVEIYFKLGIPWIMIISGGVAIGSQLLLAILKLDFQYLLWFVPYFFALPLWFIIIPVYSLWRMDDLSWGATRQTEAGGPVSH
jgi:chitin synthase